MQEKAVLLIDFDNVFISLWGIDREAAARFASDPGDWLQVLANAHLTGGPRRWLVARCYLNPAGFVYSGDNRKDRTYFSSFRPELVRAGFEVIDCPAVTRQGKNAADIRMVVDALDLLSHKTKFDEFVLASGDADFTPLLQKIRSEDRKITVVSPSFLSSAYMAIADKIIDFDGLISALNGETENGVVSRLDVGTGQVMPIGDEPSDEIRFSNFIKLRYAEATSPLNLASLAHEAARLCATATATEWFGKRTFSLAVASLRLPRLKVSGQHIWDDERHQPPTKSFITRSSNIPEVVELLMRGRDLPRIEQKDWPRLFVTLAIYAEKRPCDLAEVGRWVSDALNDQHGLRIPAGSVTFVARGCRIGGAKFDGEVAPNADEIGNAFFNALLDRAASLGIQMTPENEETIADWLGLAPLDAAT